MIMTSYLVIASILLWLGQYISQLQSFLVLFLQYWNYLTIRTLLLVTIHKTDLVFFIIATVSHNSDFISCYWLYITIATSFCSCKYHSIV